MPKTERKAKGREKTKPRKSTRGRERPSAQQDGALREHLLYLLRGGGAHLDFEKAIANLPAELRGVRPEGLPFTVWGLLEHLRIAQWDILEFSRNTKHVSPKWPAGYWPEGDAPPDDTAWAKSVKAFRSDLKAMQDLVKNPRTDLYARIPHGEGQTILREALLVADHNAYHLGQLVLVRRLLGAWQEG
ncbi:MAG: DinB family protein [Acidobacteriia bacterium]|nr:DinB family protein [Terriglobia bacterium]